MIAKALTQDTDLAAMYRVGHTELTDDARAELLEEAFADYGLAEGATYRSPVYAHPGTP